MVPNSPMAEYYAISVTLGHRLMSGVWHVEGWHMRSNGRLRACLSSRNPHKHHATLPSIFFQPRGDRLSKILGQGTTIDIWWELLTSFAGPYLMRTQNNIEEMTWHKEKDFISSREKHDKRALNVFQTVPVLVSRSFPPIQLIRALAWRAKKGKPLPDFPLCRLPPISQIAPPSFPHSPTSAFSTSPISTELASAHYLKL